MSAENVELVRVVHESSSTVATRCSYSALEAAGLSE
jgi:hypothetical protein